MDCLAPLGPVYQAGTLSGNPLRDGCGIAALKLLEESNPYPRLNRHGPRSAGRPCSPPLAKRACPCKCPKSAPCCRLLHRQHLCAITRPALTSDAALFGRFFHGCLDRGVLSPAERLRDGFPQYRPRGYRGRRACQIMTGCDRGPLISSGSPVVSGDDQSDSQI